MGYIQNYEIWHGASLGTLIINREKPIWRTMWGPCFSQKRAIFWPFLGKLKISVNKDARNLKFSLEHPWAGWLRFMKNQFEGPCRDHLLAIKRAIFWPFLGQGDYGIHPELWNLAWSIPWHIDYNSEKKQFEGPCFGHKRAIFWPYLRKGDYGINQEMWNLAWSFPGLIYYD